MKNPNAAAAFIATHAVIAAEQLLQRYTHYQLSSYWESEAIADIGTGVLWIGRHGLRAALVRVAAAIQTVWAGPASK